MQNDVLQVIMDIRGGQVAADINQKFNEVIQAVLETGRKGELAIKLVVKPSRMGMGGSVLEIEVDHESKSKLPELPIGSGTFFVTAEGQLTREDPSQSAMFEGVKNA